MKNSKPTSSTAVQGFLLVAVVAMATPIPVPAAAANDIASIVNNLISSQLANIPDLINTICYIFGAFFTGAGLLKLQQHTANPTQTKLGDAIGRLGVGAALLALPYAAGTLIQTAGLNGGAATYTKFHGVE